MNPSGPAFLKVDQVILVSTANPAYLPRWNRAARIWRTKFGVEPVLYFVGTPAEWEAAKTRGRLSEEHGVVHFLPRALPSENVARCWQAPTTLFWAASHHPAKPGTDPVRMVSGLDVVLTGPQIFECLAGVPATGFAIPLSGAYLPGCKHVWATRFRELFKRKYIYYPSAFLSARASVWRSTMAVSGDYAKFIRDTSANPRLEAMYVDVPGRWGLDEAYLSDRLDTLSGDPRIEYRPSFYYDRWHSNQLVYCAAYEPLHVRWGRYVAVNAVCREGDAEDKWLDELENRIQVWQ